MCLIFKRGEGSLRHPQREDAWVMVSLDFSWRPRLLSGRTWSGPRCRRWLAASSISSGRGAWWLSIHSRTCARSCGNPRIPLCNCACVRLWWPELLFSIQQSRSSLCHSLGGRRGRWSRSQSRWSAWRMGLNLEHPGAAGSRRRLVYFSHFVKKGKSRTTSEHLLLTCCVSWRRKALEELGAEETSGRRRGQWTKGRPIVPKGP
jgi:hypothetical protein